MKLRVKIEKYIEAAGYIIQKYGKSLSVTKLLFLLKKADDFRRIEVKRALKPELYKYSHSNKFFENLEDLINGKGEKEMQEKWNLYFHLDFFTLRLTNTALPTGHLKDNEKENLDKADKLYHYHRF